MRRKIIQQGNNSYTLTLPIGWVRDENILPGTEVIVEQEDKHLIVSLPKDARKPESKKTRKQTRSLLLSCFFVFLLF